jgi:hypothetical protein
MAADSSSTGTTRLLAELATETIGLATDGSVLARCDGEDCRMLFVRQHGRRRFCHSSCSQRARQARYQQRLATKFLDGKFMLLASALRSRRTPWPTPSGA